MSQLKVDSIVPRGGLLSGASGGIIQVVQTFKTDHFTTTSTSFVDMTGMAVTITPQSSSSKIMVDVCINSGTSTSNAGVRLLRGSTPIAISTALTGSSNNVDATFNVSSKNRISTTTSGVKFLDTPATTNATTYKLQVYVKTGGSGTEEFHLNRPELTANDGGTTDDSRVSGVVSSITLYEVSG